MWLILLFNLAWCDYFYFTPSMMWLFLLPPPPPRPPRVWFGVESSYPIWMIWLNKMCPRNNQLLSWILLIINPLRLPPLGLLPTIPDHRGGRYPRPLPAPLGSGLVWSLPILSWIWLTPSMMWLFFALHLAWCDFFYFTPSMMWLFLIYT